MSRETKLLIKIILIVIVVLTISLYTYYQFIDLLTGPQITILSPKNGSTVSDSFIKIKGQTKNITNITLNGRKIFVNEKGFFQEDLLLLYGYNIMEVEAQDRFGQTKKETLELVYN